MEKDETGIFSKAPHSKSLFLLKRTIKQNPGWSNKNYDAIFKDIHQNIRTYPRSKKKSALIDD